MVDKSEKFSTLVRIGYFSRAILYSVLGIIALTSIGDIERGTDGIFRAIENFPAGTVILWIMVIGLIAYALFRFSSTFLDVENHRSDAVGLGNRLGHAGSAIGHLAMAWSAFQFATSGSGSSGSVSEGSSNIIALITAARRTEKPVPI